MAVLETDGFPSITIKCDHCQMPFDEEFLTAEEMLIAILKERKRGEEWIFRVGYYDLLEIYCPVCIDTEVVDC